MYSAHINKYFAMGAAVLAGGGDMDTSHLLTRSIDDKNDTVYPLYIHMETTIQKWGNSLAVRLPKSVTQKLALRAGRRVRVYNEGKGVAITPVHEHEKSLKDLLAMITPANIHAETDWGKPRGREVW